MSRVGKEDPELYELVERAVRGALRNAINAHGPITEKNFASASKRVANQILATISEFQNRD